MSGVRANWHLGDLEIPDDQGTEDMGQPINLSRDVAEIDADLRATMDKEARLAQYAGVTCDLKYETTWSSGARKPPCYTCPKFTDSEWDKLSVLCALGRRQADLCDEAADAHRAEHVAASAIAVVDTESECADLIAAIEAEEAEELAEMVLR